MISNSDLTVYHRIFNKDDRSITWKRTVYKNIWWFGGKGASINKGYDNANDVEIRISYDLNPDIKDFSVGDILVKGEIETEITRQQDLDINEVYNITSIKDNTFGRRPHIHIGGK